MGVPADPRRARRSWHHGGAAHDLADPQRRRRRPGARQDGPGRAEFLRPEAQGILALDFLTAHLLNGTKAYVLAVTEHGSRRVRTLGATEHPVRSLRASTSRRVTSP